MTLPTVRWVYQWPEEMNPDFRLGRIGDRLIAEWLGFGTLRANLEGTEIDLCAAPGVDPSMVERTLRNNVAALTNHLRGGISIHASSVAREGAAVAFLGNGFAGKSTIAAQLCLQPDVELLSDDMVALDLGATEILVPPVDDGHWLRPDVAKAFGMNVETRVRTAARRAGRNAARLAALVSLVFDDSIATPVLRPLRGSDSFLPISRSIVRFVLDEPAILRAELDQIARIAEQAAVYELRRSHDLSNLAPSARLADGLLRSLTGVRE